MDRAQFADDFPGELRPSENGYLTYKPDPLPPNIEYSKELGNKLAEARGAIGKLAGIGQVISESRMLLLGPFIRREAVYSSRIEGTYATVSAVYAHEAGKEEAIEGTTRHDAEEVLRYVHATEQGLEELESGISEELIKKLHFTLMSGSRDEESPGEYRNDQRAIGHRNPNKARFVPAAPHIISFEMGELVDYINNGNDYDPLIDIALTHYQFESIHPFTDGNGRMGRLLITLMLDEYNLLPVPFLYFSSYFNTHRDEYVDRLFNVNSRGSWEEWLIFFLNGVIDQSKEVFIRSNMLLDLRNTYRVRYQERRFEAILPVIFDLFHNPITTISQSSSRLDLDYQPTRNAIKKLERDGVLNEVTGKERYQVFHAEEIMGVIDEPIEHLVDDIDEEFEKYESFSETEAAQAALKDFEA